MIHYNIPLLGLMMLGLPRGLPRGALGNPRGALGNYPGEPWGLPGKPREARGALGINPG